MTCIPDLLSPPEEFAKAVQRLESSIQERQVDYIEFSSLGESMVRRIPIFGATGVVGNYVPEPAMAGPLDGMKPGRTYRRLSEMSWTGPLDGCKVNMVQNVEPQQKPKALPAISGLTTVQDGRYQAWRDTQ